MFCGKCGYDLKGEEVSYCPYCGAPVNYQKPFVTNQNQNGNVIKDVKSDLGLMKKKNVFIAVFIIAFAVLAMGIAFFRGSYDLVGTWVCNDDNEWIITFNEDGKFYDSMSYFLYYDDVGNWNAVSEGMLYFSSVGSSATCEYELGFNTLTIYTENSTIPYYVFTKVRD